VDDQYEAMDRLDQSPENHREVRFPDSVAVAAACGVEGHAVCVGCLRQAVRASRRPPALLGCLAAAEGCPAAYGSGIRLCFTPREHAELSAQSAERTLRCRKCSEPNCRLLYTCEHTRRGRNVQPCRGCSAWVCFDCGGWLPTAEAEQSGCAACRADAAPPLRSSRLFPGSQNRSVRPQMVAERAEALLVASRTGCFPCDVCGTMLAHQGGCKVTEPCARGELADVLCVPQVLTHCGVQYCVRCGARGCASDGTIVHECCAGALDPEDTVVHQYLTRLGTGLSRLMRGCAGAELRGAAAARLRRLYAG
jgi:hypothetical protein